jgi:hypothetical protein
VSGAAALWRRLLWVAVVTAIGGAVGFTIGVLGIMVLGLPPWSVWLLAFVAAFTVGFVLPTPRWGRWSP